MTFSSFAEGDTFLNRFRLVHIGNDSADVEEISTGRHATVQMVQPPPEAMNSAALQAGTSRPLPLDLAACTCVSGLRKTLRGSGYAYLMALFMVVVLIVSTQRRRGEHSDHRAPPARGRNDLARQQFVRAIRLYYRKTGHYPQTLEDLEKGQPELHFLRYAAYKDPMKQTMDGLAP